MVDVEPHDRDGVDEPAEHAAEDPEQQAPTHGPSCQAPQAPNQVPKIIIPSMPMLTMPTRSAHRPARPAIRIGIVRRSVVPDRAGRGEVVGVGDDARDGEQHEAARAPVR